MDDAATRSDQLDHDLAGYVLQDAKRRRRINLVLTGLVVLNMLTLAVVLLVAQDTHRAVTSQIPGLQAQITAQHKAIADQQSVIDQAIAVIIRLAKQVKSLGGDPGNIIIKPPK